VLVDKIMENHFLPEPPEISIEEVEDCRKYADFRPVLFKWYKYVALICNRFSCIEIDSPALRNIPPLHFYILIGLLNRCSRLMCANGLLSSQRGVFGETTSIIDRCIFETAIKVVWLCEKADNNYFERYLGNGLKSELELKKEIENNIKERENITLVIEERMLKSIDRCIKVTQLSEEKIISSKKLPSVASMVEDLGYERLTYVVSQKLGSHAVHGTWVDLYLNYLREEDNNLVPRDNDRPTHFNQYLHISLIVLDSIKAFIKYLSLSESFTNELTELLDAIKDEIIQIRNETLIDDYKPIE